MAKRRKGHRRQRRQNPMILTIPTNNKGGVEALSSEAFADWSGRYLYPSPPTQTKGEQAWCEMMIRKLKGSPHVPTRSVVDLSKTARVASSMGQFTASHSFSNIVTSDIGTANVIRTDGAETFFYTPAWPE